MYRLTAAGIKAIKSPGRYGDGFGLYLCVGKRQSRSWIVRVQKSGRRRDIGLGSATKVSLAEARKRAAQVRSDIEAGIDPVAERRKAQGIPTFREAAVRVFEQNRKTWRNGHHQWQWMRTLEMFVFPAIGDLSVSEITAPMIRDLLAKIWLEKPETARRVRQRIGVVLDWAYSNGWRETEAPMRSITRGLPAQPRKKRHHAALPYADVPRFLEKLAAQDITVSRLALRMLILTACRSGEIRGAEWKEIDVKRRLWTIPAERMKAGTEHVVPLDNGSWKLSKLQEDMEIRAAALFFRGKG